MELSRGAEAVIERDGNIVRKTRLPKTWRHPDIDASLRRFRTRREAKVLQKAPVPAPSLLSMDDDRMIIEMSYLDGPKLRDILDADNAADLGARIGRTVKTLHEAGIIHGDLTTSNMILLDEKVHLLDFGLSEFSEHVEDKATDMRLLKHVLEASHPGIDIWEHVRRGYEPDDAFLKRFAKVESRGRYKRKRPND